MTLIDLAIVSLIFVAILLVCVVLLQPGKGDAGAIGFGGSSQSIFGSRGAGNFLTKTTAVLAGAFFVLSFVITKSRVEAKKAIDVRGNYTAPAPTTTPDASPTPAAAPNKAPAGKAGEPKK